MLSMNHSNNHPAPPPKICESYGQAVNFSRTVFALAYQGELAPRYQRNVKYNTDHLNGQKSPLNGIILVLTLFYGTRLLLLVVFYT